MKVSRVRFEDIDAAGGPVMKSVYKQAVSVFFALMFVGTMSAQYIQKNLIANRHGYQEGRLDPNLVNGWGLAYLPGSPFWVADNFTGVSTLYTGQGGIVPLVVTVPPGKGMIFGPIGSPAGLVANPTADFVISKGGNSGPALFIFSTNDGTISGWNPNVDPTNAIIMVDNSENQPPSIYTGLAIGVNSAGKNVLYAADAGPNNRIDMIDGTWTSIGSFTDSTGYVPAGLSVYGVQNVNGQLYVTFGSITPFQGGAVDVFDTNGNLVSHFTKNTPAGPLQAPWGIALAPADFNKFSNALLIGNVDDGRISAFDPATQAFLGQLADPAGKPIAIGGLWGLEFGGGSPANGQTNQLFFSAGPNGYFDGLFGLIHATGEGGGK
jgi:uncharacterized protein (TIGR03118 family)